MSEALQLPPQDLDAERAILSAVLLNPAAFSTVQELLRSEDFYASPHRAVYGAYVALTGRSEPIDLLTTGNELEARGQLSGVGGRGFLAEMLATVGSAANIAYHCRIVRDCAVRRQLIRLAHTMTERAYDKAPTEDLLQATAQQLFSISTGRDERTWCPLADVSRETVAYVDQMSKRQKETLVGVPTGYPSLDDMLGGWQPSDLIILAARTSMGKTSLALGSALAAANLGHRVGFFSLEMSRRQIGLRLHGLGAPLDVHALRTGSLTPQGWFHFANAAEHLSSLPFWIDDSSLLSVEQVAAKARHLKALHGLDVVVLDYLQLLQLSHAETRQQGVADASRKLKLLAKELDIPVIVLSQLSRECEKRPDPRPMLSDLRDSGAIEQDADVVLFIYRDEVYNPHSEDRGIAEILVRKHRNGPVGVRRLVFIERYAQFSEMDPVHQ